jgi:hypothetical protein
LFVRLLFGLKGFEAKEKGEPGLALPFENTFQPKVLVRK